MKRLVGVVILLILMLPAAAGAQQIGNTAQGSLLQSGGGGLQQTPAGLQGSAPEIFSGNKSGLLDQSSQKLLDGIGPSSKTGNQKLAEINSVQPSSDHSKTFLAGLCLALAGLAFIFWFRLRQFS